MIHIRKQTELFEQNYLSKFATLSVNTKGREKPQKLCDLRTEFQRDRDRIIHCKAFRRLKHKTQVFITPEGDHYRTRLTHTLEVAQIGRTIARALRLNEDLVEAIALGHDLGHTPFGHSGEDVLNRVCPYGFKHYEQSLRVVDVLERKNGLNLTYEVRDGIVNHTGKHIASTPEGKIIKFADRIAYVNHDIDDAIRGGIIKKTDIPEKIIKKLGSNSSKRINTLICAIIEKSMDTYEIDMEEETHATMLELRDYMYEHVYKNKVAKAEEKKAMGIIEALYNHFLENPETLPADYQSEDVHRNVCDYIAGMTDNYVIHTYKELFVPKSWNVL